MVDVLGICNELVGRDKLDGTVECPFGNAKALLNEMEVDQDFMNRILKAALGSNGQFTVGLDTGAEEYVPRAARIYIPRNLEQANTV
ncbi:unnamed protein product [Caenorhabditis bovis]|uniref:Uncharacterized protein n=1 Tax=Caenorhabditis bovis TaxID=2654633 RepID=A0A8S1FD64_9PELO|nr:unnamed protein product [Caenorhabditis bovis]